MKKQLLIVGLIVLFILTIDQVLKIWVKTHMSVYDDDIKIFGDWFKMIYIENQGMAFGTTFGSSIWAKLALSIFRIGAIIGIGIYWFRQAKLKVRLEFLIALGLIFSGAFGNLIDSMFYDFTFKDIYDPCLNFNHLEGSGIKTNCPLYGVIETRHTGFLLGNVVDMFQFNFRWPSWMPWLAGKEIFPAIWNIADASISIGVIMILFRQRKYFPKKRTTKESDDVNTNEIILEESTQE